MKYAKKKIREILLIIKCKGKTRTNKLFVKSQINNKLIAFIIPQIS